MGRHHASAEASDTFQPARAPQAVIPKPVAATEAVVIQGRQGQELRAGLMLVRDDFPFMHTSSLQDGERPQPTLAGAFNFRRLPDAPIYGMSQPTAQGIRNALNHLNAGPSSSGPAPHWINMREEPVVYLEGSPLFLMDTRRRFTNVEAPGSTVEQVEQREEQIKQDIYAEAARSGGKLLVHRVLPGQQMSYEWLEIAPDSVQTTREVFEQVRSEGYRVEFHRVPVTDEQSPDPQDFDALTRQLSGLPADTPRVFNCQMGRGRTTTGMVAAQLVAGQATAPGAPPKVKFDKTFAAIHSWLLQVGAGMVPLAGVNWAIAKADAVQNLRDSIVGLQQKVREDANPEHSRRLDHYMHRYEQLVAYNAYLQEGNPTATPFGEWLQSKA
ncbi:hypothetical protein IV102_02210 [bacterium]|nr:hypothetical protein [bacterium]